MRRAVTSITANIAEGFGRHSYKEKIQFYYQANGSLTELIDHCYTARDIGYLHKNKFLSLISQTQTTYLLLQGLIKKSKTFL